MKSLSILSFCFLLCSCISKQISKDDLACLQLVGRNGITETISTKTRLLSYEKTDFLSPQPYRQILRVYKKNTHGKIPSLLTTYHSNGLLYQYIEIQDGRACGKYRQWHPNGQLHITASVMEGPADLSFPSQKQWLFDGDSFIWDDQGNLSAKIPYLKGALQGTAVYYFANGMIEKIIPYQQNEIDGEAIYYTPEGNLCCSSKFKQGYLDGISEGYRKDFSLSFFERYEKGSLLNGTYYDAEGKIVAKIENGNGTRCLYKDKQIIQTISYEKGKPYGTVQIWNEQGDLVRLFHIYDDKKSGEEILFYLPQEIPGPQKNPTPKLSLYWQEDMLHGLVKTWYPEGILESEKEIQNNKKNGSCFCWYIDGTLMLIEEYENDLLKEGTYYKKSTKEPISIVRNGKGIATLYDKNGIFLQKIQYENGKPIPE